MSSTPYDPDQPQRPDGEGGSPSGPEFDQQGYGAAPRYGQQPGQGQPYGQSEHGQGQNQPPQYGGPQSGGAPQYGGPQSGGAPQYGGQQYGGQQGYQSGNQMSDADQRLWATLTHLSGLVFSFVAPLVVWLVLKERGRFVEDQTKEALNFQITVAIASVAITIISIITLGIGSILFVLLIVPVIFMVLAAVASNRGEWYRYPINIRLVK